MQGDEFDLLEKRIDHIKGELGKRVEENVKRELSIKLELLLAKRQYLIQGGPALKSDDSLGDIDFQLKKKKKIINDLSRGIELLPYDDVERPGFEKILRVLSAQYDYLTAKRKVILENRSLPELSHYIRLAEEEDVEIYASPLEHEAELQAYKPSVKESRKKVFAPNFQKMGLYIAIIFFLIALYAGISWRKTPYDREIIRSYGIGRAYYFDGNDRFIKGDYQGAVNSYATAAAFFNRAKSEADLAASTKKGKMNIYFENKGEFFHQWELISLKMADSSNAFRLSDTVKGAQYANEASSMVSTANTYNDMAEEAWSLL